MSLLSRDDLIDGLRELIAEIQGAGESATLRIVGGGAMTLRHVSRRAMTQDVDALRLISGTESTVLEAAARVATRHGWAPNWFNFEVAAADAEPRLGSRTIRWETIYDDRGVIVQVADAASMLAMKLRANRPGRDTDDIRQLLAICSIETVDVADDFYGEFYPGDALSQRAWQMVSAILSEGPLSPPESPGPVDLSPR
jgi:hypothetical protein